MEELQSRHRKEFKDLQSRVTQKKKQATKKTRKGVNDECDKLEAELKQKQAAEIAALDGTSQDEPQEPPSEQLAEVALGETNGDHDTASTDGDAKHAHEDANGSSAGITEELSSSSRTKKPSRQKARLARRAAEQEDIARQAAEEAQNLPDMKQQERGRMLDYMQERKLIEKEIRADGHCLYSAVADQLDQIGIALGSKPGDKPELPYKLTRTAAADYIEQHADDFAGFLEEPLGQYVHKIRDTAEWGGQLELQALANSYGVEINVLQDFGRVEKVAPGVETEGKSIWLGYYKHGFGLGEHYNSLRNAS